VSFVVGLIIICPGAAIEKPEIQVAVNPPYSDRLFPYITYQDVWKGTPARRDDVAVPNVLIVYGGTEDIEIVAEAGKLAFYLGNWVSDVGFDVEHFKEERMPSVLCGEDAIPESAPPHHMVVGQNNHLVKQYGIRFEKPSVIHRKSGRAAFLFVGGKTKAETIAAIRYMGDVRLNFKSGAYKTFFSFVRLRGYIEKGNYFAALEIIKSPGGVSACGRNMALAAESISKAPDKVKRHVQHRNALLYKKLPAALEKEERATAIQLWHKAMKTCYACHQGRTDFPRLRKFKPIELIHSKHQRIAERAEFGNACGACHMEETQIRGYE
jgi:hypothetical protein